MNAGMTGILFASMVLAILLLTLVFRTSWHLMIKAAAIFCVIALCQSTITSYPSLTGWPTTIRLPQRFNLEGVQFDEPNKSTQSRGRIFIWATDLKDIRKPVPRAYVLPYTPALHTKLYDAGQKLRKSIPQFGEVITVRNPITAKEEIDLLFFDMPDVLLPK
ncbi:MAG: hypothetical protein ACRESK_00255 [Gammaproteobacteria bacterium]